MARKLAFQPAPAREWLLRKSNAGVQLGEKLLPGNGSIALLDPRAEDLDWRTWPRGF